MEKDELISGMIAAVKLGDAAGFQELMHQELGLRTNAAMDAMKLHIATEFGGQEAQQEAEVPAEETGENQE